MKRRAAKMAFAGIVLLFWAVCLALVLEAGQRFIMRGDAVDGYASPIIARAEQQDMAVYDDTLAGAPRPPAEVAAKYPVLEALDRATDAVIGKLAGQWEGVVLQGDLKGNIRRRYAAAAPELAVLLGAKAAAAANIRDLLPDGHPEYGDDLMSRLDLAVSEWRRPGPSLPHMIGCLGASVDYAIPLPGYPNAGFRFMFRPVPSAEGGDPLVLTVVVPWRWDALFGGFRSNYYERDAYPQFPKSEFWTNSRGLRDVEITVPKPAGTYRIICIGGSTTLEGPRNDLTYPKMLQQLLREHFNTDSIEVVNCGVDGGTIRGQGYRFADCLALEPDMVIHYNYVNDTRELIDNVLRATVVVPRWRGSLTGFLCGSQFLTRRCRGLWAFAMPQEADYRTEIDRFLMPSLRELCGKTRQAGARFVLSSFACPDVRRIPPMERAWFQDHFFFEQVIRIQFEDYAVSVDAFNGAVRDFCRTEGALYVPVAEGIRGGLETFTDQCHMHIPGIRHKAQIMFDHVKDAVAESLVAHPAAHPAPAAEPASK